MPKTQIISTPSPELNRNASGEGRERPIWVGARATMGLAFPIYNTLRHWKYRKCRLVLPGDIPLATAFDDNGCAIKRDARGQGEAD